MDRYLLVSARRVLPRRLEKTVVRGKSRIDTWRLRGNTVLCPVCGSTFSRFLPFSGRPGARCPRCLSLERHRLLWLLLQRDPRLLATPMRILHIAPEKPIADRLSRLDGVQYVSADLLDPDAMLTIDVTAIDLPDASFDAVICSHVLEHVADDRLALRELLRILKPTGWAVLDAPVDWSRPGTYEDWSITGPQQRAAAFGQWDHVRVYGRDYPQILAAAGWDVDMCPVEVTAGEARRMGLRPALDRIYLCRPAAAR